MVRGSVLQSIGLALGIHSVSAQNRRFSPQLVPFCHREEPAALLAEPQGGAAVLEEVIHLAFVEPLNQLSGRVAL